MLSKNQQVYHVYRTQFVDVGLATPVIAVITAGIRPVRSKCHEINEIHLTISVKVTGNWNTLHQTWQIKVYTNVDPVLRHAVDQIPIGDWL